MSYTIEITWVEGATDEQRKAAEDFVRGIKEELDNADFPEGVMAVKVIKDADAAQA